MQINMCKLPNPADCRHKTYIPVFIDLLDSKEDLEIINKVNITEVKDLIFPICKLNSGCDFLQSIHLKLKDLSSESFEEITKTENKSFDEWYEYVLNNHAYILSDEKCGLRYAYEAGYNTGHNNSIPFS